MYKFILDLKSNKGGLSLPLSFTEEEMKILILFALKSAGGILETETLCDVVASGDVNYIDIKTALAEIIKLGLAQTYEDNENILLVISPNAELVVRELKNKIPITVREKVAAAASVAISKIKRDILVKAKISKPDEKGCCVVTTELLNDDESLLLKMEIFAPTELQGEMMAKKFRENPSEVYEKVIAALQ